MDLENVVSLQLAGIPINDLRKGDQFTADQVLHTMHKMDPKLSEKIRRFENGEISDPRPFLAVALVKRIERIRLEMGKPVVCKTIKGGIRVLTDGEADKYLDAQANAGLRKHRARTHMMFTSVDVNQLTEHQKREFEARQKKHSFIMAAHQGAKTQSLRMQRKGLKLPKFGEVPKDDE